VGPQAWIAAAFVILLFGCAPASSPHRPTEFCGESALEFTRQLVALGPRDAGTDGAQRAAQWIAQRLRELGWQAEVDKFADISHDVPWTFFNVVAHRRGARRDRILFGAHFDTKRGIPPPFEGANDSGSGVGVLLELARVGANWRWPCDVTLAFFDGEECRVAYGPRDGLHGSRWLAQRAVREGWSRQVRAVIVVDMVGDRDWTPTLPLNAHPAVLTALLEAAQSLGLRDRVRLAQGPILDDHQPFLDAGMPAAVVIDFEYGSRPGANDYWHTPEDRMDKLAAQSLEWTGRLILEAAWKLVGHPRAAHDSAPRSDVGR